MSVSGHWWDMYVCGQVAGVHRWANLDHPKRVNNSWTSTCHMHMVWYVGWKNYEALSFGAVAFPAAQVSPLHLCRVSAGAAALALPHGHSQHPLLWQCWAPSPSPAAQPCLPTAVLTCACAWCQLSSFDLGWGLWACVRASPGCVQCLS